MMKEKEILDALQTAVANAILASIKPSLKWKPVGMTFETPSADDWLEIVHIPNNVQNAFWGSERRYRGLFRLIFHAPLIQVGAIPTLDMIASVCGFFNKDKTFQSGDVSVRIYDEPELTGVIENSPELLYPVTLRYESFQP